MKSTRSYSCLWVLGLMAMTACKELSEGVEIVEDGDIRKVLMNESFERAALIETGVSQDLFGWRAFIWDFGTPVIGPKGRNVAAVIMGDSSMGQSFHGNKALYMYGREGSSIHSIYLFTHAYDLTDFDEVLISFRYLMFDLNDTGDTVDEFLRLEVCADTPANCGAGTTVDNNKLNGNSWQILVDADDRQQRANLNGKNHTAADWMHAGVRVDISQFPKKDAFIFRLNTKMNDGFVRDDLRNSMEDGVAVDKIEVVGVQKINPQPPVDPCDPNLPRINDDSCYNIPFEDLRDPLGL